MITTKNLHWKVNKELAKKYSIPLDRQLYCDTPLLNALGNVKGRTIIDIGCGNGGLTRAIADKGALVTGVDTSEKMLKQAKQLNQDLSNLHFQVGAAEQLPFNDSEFDNAVCSMTVNTFSNRDMVEGMFKEASRVTKSNAKVIISLPHPFTLDQRTKFRWTEWALGQTQQNLKPGDAVKRKIMGRNGEMISVVNYYWPPDFLSVIANKNNLPLKETLESLASEEELHKYPELDPALKETPFFLVMSFSKK